MKKEPKEIIGFHFQVIPLEEARAMAIAGTGNYADLKATLLNKIPTLQHDEAFAFGLPKGEVPEDQRRGICMALNAALRKAAMPWRTTYSGVKQLFILIPKNGTGKYSVKHESGNGSKENTSDKQILDLWRQGVSVRKIIKQLNANPMRVQYLCYQKNPRQSISRVSKDDGFSKMQAMLNEASQLFNVTPEQIRKGAGRGKLVRKAICKVASGQGMTGRLIGEFVGLTKDGVAWNARSKPYPAQSEIEKLEEFYRR